MCVHPLHKKNPYFGADPASHPTHDCEHEYLNIPCGHCGECLAVRQSSYVQRIQMESEHNHLFFATLTYDNKHLPSIYLDVPTGQDQMSQNLEEDSQQVLPFSAFFAEDGSFRPEMLPDGPLDARLEECLKAFDADTDLPGTSSGIVDFESSDPQVIDSETIRIDYADVHHLQLMFKRMRDNNALGRNFRYIAVSERGSKRGRPHFHIIFLIPKEQGDNLATCETLNEVLKDMLLKYWSTNVGTRKNPVYERNFTYRERWIGRKLYRNFDCHYVNPVLTTDGVADVAFYVTKYIFKDSEKENNLKQYIFCKTADITEFKAVWDIVKSRCVCSKGLGLDATFSTEETICRERKPLYQIAEEKMAQVGVFEDLPGDDFELTPVQEFREIVSKHRVMHPNPEIVSKLKGNALLEKETGHAVFVKYNGEHVPLANYFAKRVLDLYDVTDLYYSWDPIKYPDMHYDADNRAINDGDAVAARTARILDQIESHDILDGRSFEIEKGRSIDPYDPYVNTSKLLNLDGIVRPKTLLGK